MCVWMYFGREQRNVTFLKKFIWARYTLPQIYITLASPFCLTPSSRLFKITVRSYKAVYFALVISNVISLNSPSSCKHLLEWFIYSICTQPGFLDPACKNTTSFPEKIKLSPLSYTPKQYALHLLTQVMLLVTRGGGWYNYNSSIRGKRQESKPQRDGITCLWANQLATSIPV
jgi:hypothetical protein